MQDGTAWVTGGGTGIGRGIALALAEDGYGVYISGRREQVLTDAVRDAGDLPGRLIALQADVTDVSQLNRAISRILADRGRIDVAVISAGTNVPRRTLSETTPDDWRAIVDANATGAFQTMQAVLQPMRSQGSGLIVNIVSIAGLRALEMAGVAYSASKFAQRALGVFAANEASVDGVRVTNVYPGEVDTPILDRRAAPPSRRQRGRMVHPSDIGEVVRLLARLPSTAHVSELVIKPTCQDLV